MTTLQSYFENCYRHTFTRYQFIKKGATNNSNNFLDHGFEWFVRSERVGGYNIIFEEVSIDEYPWQYCNLQFHPCKEFWIETNKCNWKHSDRSQKSLCHQQTLPSRIYCCDKKLYYYYYYYYYIAVLLFVSQIWMMCVEVSIRFEKWWFQWWILMWTSCLTIKVQITRYVYFWFQEELKVSQS